MVHDSVIGEGLLVDKTIKVEIEEYKDY